MKIAVIAVMLALGATAQGQFIYKSGKSTAKMDTLKANGSVVVVKDGTGTWNLTPGGGSLDSSKLVTKHDLVEGVQIGNATIQCSEGESQLTSGLRGIIDVTDDIINIVSTGKKYSNVSTINFDTTGVSYTGNKASLNISNPRWIPDKAYVDSFKSQSLGDTVKYFGSGNIKIGVGNIQKTSTGNSNISIGNFSIGSITSGYSNIGIGTGTLEGIITESGNTALGFYAGTDVHGYNNLFLGRYAGSNFGHSGYNWSNRIFISTIDRGTASGDTTKSPIYILQDADMSKQIINLNGVVKVNGSEIGSASVEDTLYISSANILLGINDTLINTSSPTTKPQNIYTTCLISYRHVSTAYTGGTTDTIAVFGKYKGVKKKLLYISSSYITDAYSGRGQFPLAWDKLDPGSPIWVHIPAFSTGNGVLRMRFIKKQETW